ncbi:MAG TPA: hypothetical protein DD733_06910, partial [Clostridiales bacterium]|nr:hypothetical protein [Clostridiales bacterium]
GDGAEKIFNHLRNKRIEVKGVFASEGFVRGQEFLGFRVMSISEAEEEFDDFAAVLCFALEGEKAQILKLVKAKHTLYSPNLPVYGSGIFDKKRIFDNIERVQRLYDFLADEISKEIFLSVLKYNITGEYELLCSDKGIFSYPEGFFRHNKRHIDVGAYDGDTVIEFASRCKDYADIVAFEPDRHSYCRLLSNTTDLRAIICENAAVSDRDGSGELAGKGSRSSFIKSGGGNTRVVSIDSYCKQHSIGDCGISVGSIKIDAEGADRQVLQGAVNTIYNNSPDIMVALYHRAEDFIDLPLLIRSYDYRYKLYLRKKDYIPVWDIFLLASK